MTALTDAQAKGYAEADPTLDIQGMDTAHELAIIVSLAYGIKINYEDIYIEGISRITAGHRLCVEVRLAIAGSSAEQWNQIEARVHPTMIPSGNLLSNVNGSLNAVMVSGDAVKYTALWPRRRRYQRKCGKISDIIAIFNRKILFTDRSAESTAFLPAGSDQENPRSCPSTSCKRIITSGLAPWTGRGSVQIAGILGDQDISIQSVREGPKNERLGSHRHADASGQRIRRASGRSRNSTAGR